VDHQLQSRWQLTRRHVLWAVGIIAFLTVSVFIGYRYGITLWDWIKLLIVPAVIAGGGLWFNRQQRERELEIAREQREQEVAIAERRAQDEALQAYLDQMSHLLLEKKLRNSEEDAEIRALARAHTLRVLRQLDPNRKRNVLEFLYQSKLITRSHRVILLWGANLHRASLQEIFLVEADLSALPREQVSWLDAMVHGDHRLPKVVASGRIDFRETNLLGANLSEASLREADLRNANLRLAILYNTDLRGADLRNANLQEAILSKAFLRGDSLRGADFREAALRGMSLLEAPRLRDANLRGADLSGADLSSAEVKVEHLVDECASLKGATMPNGQKYEDWLKSKD
jgi:uncharacterized protein YjbI with pentapeptide repeats